MRRCEQWVTVKASATRVLAAFSDPNCVPRWIERVIAVLAIDERHSFWLTEAAAGTNGRWVAEKIESAPNRSAYLLNEGCARALLEAEATEETEGGCRLRFVVSDQSSISWRGVPGPVILFGEDVAAELQRSLQAFKSIVEISPPVEKTETLPVKADSRSAVEDVAFQNISHDGEAIAEKLSRPPAERATAEVQLKTSMDTTGWSTDGDASRRKTPTGTGPQKIEPEGGERISAEEAREVGGRRAGPAVDSFSPEVFSRRSLRFGGNEASDEAKRKSAVTESSLRRHAFPWVYAFVFFAIAFSSGVFVWLAKQETLTRGAQTRAEAAPGGGTEPAPKAESSAQAPPVKEGASAQLAEKIVPSSNAVDELRAKVAEWARATNRGGLDELMQFYAPVLERYYLQRNVSRADVRADKARYLSSGQRFNLEIAAPRIALSPDGRRATMTFLKRFNFAQRRGAATQQLVWEKRADWQIVSERDLAAR
ncbi:MAG: hypothetical protein C4334_05135 [Pyrinomonas sp.]|uniref:hypothetical protein n=1 Tax=Pyrinomonas sp. TaxID=2080306 RepID=UPI00331B32CE